MPMVMPLALRIPAALAVLLVVAPASAQDYPNRPVRIVIGFGPGSVADTAARVLGNRMSQTLGQQIVVENRAGAGSNLGAEYVARAPKDGYTLFMATIANTINPALRTTAVRFRQGPRTHHACRHLAAAFAGAILRLASARWPN